MIKMCSQYSVLIDSNGLAALSCYFEVCNKLEIEVGSSIEDIKKNIEFDKKYVNFAPLKSAFRIWTYLKKKQNENDVFTLYISQFADMELRDVLVNRLFDEHLSKYHFPFRLQKKRPLRHQVCFNYDESVSKPCELVYKTLQDNGFYVEIPELDNASFTRDVCSVMKMLANYVFLDVMDAYFYCLSVLLLVDEILTSDEEFRVVVNHIKSTPEWNELRNGFVSLLASNYQSIKLGIESSSISEILPQAIPPPRLQAV
jgi:hypothetical protein